MFLISSFFIGILPIFVQVFQTISSQISERIYFPPIRATRLISCSYTHIKPLLTSNICLLHSYITSRCIRWHS
jgi:hypothetical protein